MREFRKAIELDDRNALVHYDLGSALRMKGQQDAAIREYKTAIDLDPMYINAYGILGLTLLDIGRFSEAQEATRQCLELMSSDNPLRQAARQQLNQCEESVKLDLKLSAVLAGKGQPTEGTERLALARLCQQPYKKLYATSARFYGDEFDHDAVLSSNMQQQYRYNAACAAAPAGCGQGNDADKLDTKDHIRLRNQARAWLRADLDAWAKLTDQGKADDRAAAEKALQHWQTDPDLAGIRDPAPLAKLPEHEQEACRKLWADVEALLKKAQEAKK